MSSIMQDEQFWRVRWGCWRPSSGVRQWCTVLVKDWSVVYCTGQRLISDVLYCSKTDQWCTVLVKDWSVCSSVLQIVDTVDYFCRVDTVRDAIKSGLEEQVRNWSVLPHFVTALKRCYHLIICPRICSEWASLAAQSSCDWISSYCTVVQDREFVLTLTSICENSVC